MTFIDTPFENPGPRWALVAVVLLGLLLVAAALVGSAEWTALALNPQPEPPGAV